MRVQTFLLILWFSWTAHACGRGGETHFLRKPSTLQEIETVCDEWLAWHQRCQQAHNEYPGDDWYGQCVADPRWAVMWSDYAVRVGMCFETQECGDGSSDDACFEQVVAEMTHEGLIDPQDAIAQKCVQRANECPIDEVTDDACGAILFMHDHARGSIARCVDELSCTDLEACIHDPIRFAMPEP